MTPSQPPGRRQASMPTRRLLRDLLAGAASRTGALRHVAASRGVVILMLHKVAAGRDPLQISISPSLLDQALAEVSRHARFIAFEEIDRQALNDPRLRCCITFDDGYEDNYTAALPILETHAAPATVFITTGYIETGRVPWYESLSGALDRGQGDVLDLSGFELPSYRTEVPSERTAAMQALKTLLKRMPADRRDAIVAQVCQARDHDPTSSASRMLSWRQIRAMVARGVAVGSHTVGHCILSRETDHRVETEIRDSKAVLEQEVGQEVLSFAYPNGTAADYDQRAIDALRRCGYRRACTTIGGRNEATTPLFELRRVGLFDAMCIDRYGNFSAPVLWAKLLGVL